jgi:HD superfamily phosphohydrolase
MSKRIEIRCPIYGFIPLDEWEYDVVHQPAFQRLRRIRQLAWTDYVYPGAMHTRFEHTLGVMHMAGLVFDRLTEEGTASREEIVRSFGGEADALRRSRRVVRLAALLHDVGHSPFSHAAEELMPERDAGKRWEHEDYSAAIIRSKLADVIDGHPRNAYGITAALIADLIMGEAGAGRELLWRPLVSGQIDADRMDYLLRDSHHAGVDYGRYDWHRLVSTMTMTPANDTGAPHIGVTEGGWNVAESLVVARYMMFNQVYFHKTRVILDHHLHHAMALLLPDGTFPPPSAGGLDAYLAWDDWRVLGLLANGDGGEHGRRLVQRDLFKPIRETPPYPKDEDVGQLAKWRTALGDKIAADIPSEKSWYKIGDTDVPVVSEDGRRVVRPLSHFSPIVTRMGQMRQVRLYVRSGDRATCEAQLRAVEAA